MTEEILALFALYGLPGICVILAAGQFGVPLPTSILLMTAGALIADGDLSAAQVFAWALAGAVLGDQSGYAVARLGGRSLLGRVFRGGASDTGNFARAERFSAKWGGFGVFFSRWLVSPLGPWINLTSGLTRYHWGKFLLWDLAGETVWIIGYLSIGYAFSRSIASIAELLANLGWLIGAAALTVLLGVLVRRAVKRHRGRGAGGTRSG
ncbi:DedA family protein [Nitratireductor rhodophyticola]|uniref:DedA family protein n=1 Tax=Nitratireductor rhodophyticola TaxID=2854036 RepID=UPI002AC94F95|nr:DedA family protein [Nitratireductor rhodophyticola]WPZ13848.1 DedA family protein [Nitratireductor rhodophyticola]